MSLISAPPLEAASPAAFARDRRGLRRLWPESGAISPIPALDGLRAVAVLLTIAYHAWTSIPSAPIGVTAYRYPINYGRTGVHLFFVLSGFLLFLPYARWLFGLQARPSARLFYRRRALRVGPAYWACLAILTITGPLTAFALLDSALHALFLSNISAQTVGEINSVFWTMAVEVQFYVMLPLLGWLAARLARLLTPIGAGLTLFITLLATSIGAEALVRIEWVRQLPFYTFLLGDASLSYWIAIFGCGIACAIMYTYLRQVRPFSTRAAPALRAVAGVLGIAGVCLALSVTFLPRLHALPLKNETFGVAYGLLLFGVLFGPAPLRVPFSARVMRFVGLISYSVYLWHTVILGLIEPHLTSVASFPAHIAIGAALDLLLTLPVAYVSYQLTERPFLKARQRSHDRPAAPPQQSVPVSLIAQ
ncbi:MAG TPA: acyltransferase [Ktedonobacterales bacterium]|nr:acyltransferase [Ktedonobacterales bacterium]